MSPDRWCKANCSSGFNSVVFCPVCGEPLDKAVTESEGRKS